MRAVFLATSILALSGCYSLHGTPQIVNAGGVVNQEGSRQAPSENLRDNFRHYLDIAVTEKVDTTTSARNMVESGFVLVQANCADFFREMGKQQRVSHIARDTIAPIITLATGIIGLTNFTEMSNQEDALEILTLASGLTISVLDIHAEHFLFGAENIHQVQELTFKALETHRNGVRAQGAMRFEPALMHLIDHQVICTPASILSLTQRAISVGNPVPSENGAGESADSAVLLSLGEELNLPGRASWQQAQMLWKHFRGGGLGPSDYAEGVTAFAVLRYDSPFTQGENGPEFRSDGLNGPNIMRILERFSSTARQRFDHGDAPEAMMVEANNPEGGFERVSLDVE